MVQKCKASTQTPENIRIGSDPLQRMIFFIAGSIADDGNDVKKNVRMDSKTE